MKYLKYLKYILIIWLVLTVLIIGGGIIKYNIDLNNYIKQEEPKSTKNDNRPFSHQTEVYILGTVHFETDKIKRDDFYHFLDNISPDIILYESDTKTVRRMLKRTDFFWQCMSAFKKGNKVESFIAHRYLKNHPECKVLPYEWEKRDSYQLRNNLSNRTSELINSVLRLERENRLSRQQSSVVKNYLEVNKAYWQISRNAKQIADFNNENTDDLIRERQLYVYKYLPEIAKRREDLEEFDDFIPIHMNYWDTRNKAMVENILNQIKRYPNKRIVVLTGFSHHYYLMDELKQYQTEFNFSIR